jgi:2-desacetyl-2-hydroxyethyl bacteriochlorophyllide A dehydrogenase
MRAIVVSKPGEFAYTEAPDPAPARDGVVVRVGACGICGTDLHILEGEFAPTPYPIIPGHEFAGEVVAVGEDARGALSVGDRVAVDPSLFCGHCEACRQGRGNLCQNWGAVGDTVDGAFAELVAVPAANAYRIPPEMTWAEAALVEPVSCAVHGTDRLGPVLGEDVLVVGAGTMGLLLMQLLVRAGASSVTVADLVPQRLAVATSLGASDVAGSLDDLAGSRFSVVVDASGAPAAIEQALSLVRRGGRFMVFGVAPSEARVSMSPFQIYNDEVTVIGSMAVLHSYGRALQLLAAGALRTGELLTPALPLASYGEAIAQVRAGQGVKTQLVP